MSRCFLWARELRSPSAWGVSLPALLWRFWLMAAISLLSCSISATLGLYLASMASPAALISADPRTARWRLTMATLVCAGATQGAIRRAEHTNSTRQSILKDMALVLLQDCEDLVLAEHQ